MTSTDINDLSILDIYIWPDYETAQAASKEYGAKIRDASQKAGAKFELNKASWRAPGLVASTIWSRFRAFDLIRIS